MKVYHSIFLLFFPLLLAAQDRTVGVFQNDSLAFNGYTLFTPTASTVTYLIDNCGHQVNHWTSDHRPGLAVYLLKDGSLLRTARINSSFNAGGTGGRIEKFTWAGDLLWAYDYSSEDHHQHHDITPMPNGNILVLAWEAKNGEEVLAAGREPTLVSNTTGLWLEHIVELQPSGNAAAQIVWEWHIWDHLVQDFDVAKNNFGEIMMHPELVNFNNAPVGANPDWLHINSIDYNPILDQIVLSSRNLNEFWIIDHNTTSEEAAGEKGDLLYRWGNPQVYDRGTAADQRLFGQHHVHWIPEGNPDEGKIILFNNGVNRPDGNFSSIDILTLPIDAAGYYLLETGQAFGPEDLYWTYQETDFYSVRISGAQRLPNGHTLICDGVGGVFFEVTTEGEKLWEYINPVGDTGPVIQGNPVSGNNVFRTHRYAPDYPAFDDRDLIPGLLVELNSIADDCQIYKEGSTPTLELLNVVDFRLFPNPVADYFQIIFDDDRKLQVKISDIAGRKIFAKTISGARKKILTDSWPSGLYIIQIFSPEGYPLVVQKIIKE